MDAFNAADAQRHLQDVSEVSVRLLRTPCLIRHGAERLPRRTRQIFPRVTGSKPRTPLEDDVFTRFCHSATARASLQSSDFMQMNIHQTEGKRRRFAACAINGLLYPFAASQLLTSNLSSYPRTICYRPPTHGPPTHLNRTTATSSHYHRSYLDTKTRTDILTDHLQSRHRS